ncbi:hypothetical protein Tco_0007860 [Tanacetum coccineum]
MGGPHETYQCQPMNEDYYHEQNSCYDYNSFGFDQFQPPQYTVNHPIFNAQNDFLNSQNKLMEQMTSICDMVGQYMQKKEEEKRIAEEQAAKDRYWKIPICYDDDEDYTIAIAPSEGIPDSVCDVPLCNDPTPLEAFKEHFEIVVDFNDDSTLSDDDSPYCKDIDYVDASPPDAEIVSLEAVEIVIPEVGGIDTDILLTIKDDILHNSSPLPSEDSNSDVSDAITESFSPSPIPVEDSDSLMEEIDLFLTPDDSMPPGIETDDYDSEGDILFFEELLTDDSLSLPEHESFHFESDYDPSSPRPLAKPLDDDEIEPDTGLLTTKVVGDISEHYVLIPRLLPTQPTLCPVIQTLLPFSSENMDKVHLLSHRGFKASKLFHQKSPMLIHGDNTPNFGVRHLHFYHP